MQIQGKIIRILDTRTVIINLGKNHGIEDSSIFNILGNPEPIVDPFIHEELGLVSVVKSKVKAVQVHDRFTIASTKWSATYLKLTANLGAQFGSLLDTETIDQGELRVNSEEIQPWKAKSETPVRVGDIVEVEVSESSSSVRQEVESNNDENPAKSESGNKTDQDASGN